MAEEKFCNDTNPMSQQEKHDVDEEEVPAVWQLQAWESYLLITHEC